MTVKFSGMADEEPGLNVLVREAHKALEHSAKTIEKWDELLRGDGINNTGLSGMVHQNTQGMERLEERIEKLEGTLKEEIADRNKVEGIRWNVMSHIAAVLAAFVALAMQLIGG